MSTKVDLDDLEQIARSAIADNDYVDGRGSPTPEQSLAMIARIRELEAAVERAAACLEARSGTTDRREWAAHLREDIARGALLP